VVPTIRKAEDLDTTILTFMSAFLGAFLGYLTNMIYYYRSRPRIEVFGFVWRPGTEESRHKHKIDQGDLLKFWFRLKGRTSPGACTLEIIYYPTKRSERPEVSVFAKWDETANPEMELRKEDGTIERLFRGDRVPATYFLALRIGRVYTVPILWAQPRAEDRSGEAARSRMLIFSGWWFDPSWWSDPQSPRPRPVANVSQEGRIELILSGEGLRWERSFAVAEILDTTNDLAHAESDARQADISEVLPLRYIWKRMT